MPKKARVFSRDMKLAAVRRMMAGESVGALAREFKLRRHLLYLWRDNFRAGGPSAFWATLVAVRSLTARAPATVA
jgi:transposase